MGGQCRSAVATAFLVGGCWLAIATPAAACGPDSDCQVDGRSYRVVVPAVADAPRGAIIFAHGYRGSAAGSLGNPGLAGLADSLGVVVAAAQATGPEWSVPGVPSDDAVTGVDELAYVEAIADDLARRLDVDRERIVVSGFSSGAMLVWHLACHGGDRFAGFVPLSGTFWQPLPERCPTSSVNLVHYHGDADAIVPLAGRPIKDAHQGDVEAALALLVEGGGYEPAPASAQAGLRCSGYRNSAGKRLELCLFAGGHSFDPSYLARAWQLLVPTDAG
jgi:polyhydroxybutyrate depolymerase